MHPRGIGKASRYSKSRQKSCSNCVAAKIKCDRARPSCMKCKKLSHSCQYPETSISSDLTTSDHNSSQLPSPLGNNTSTGALRTIESSGQSSGQQSFLDAAIGPEIRTNDERLLARFRTVRNNTTPYASSGAISDPMTEPLSGYEELNFTSLELICPINAGEICNRWLNAFVPDPDQTSKQYPPNVASFILHVLKAYAGTVVHGVGVPPFIHHTQIEKATLNQPLCTCLSLVRTCDTLLPGSHAASASILQNEVDRLSRLHYTYSAVTLLSAYQACLIYSLALQFWLRDESAAFLRQALMYLQELACATSREGLVCIEEQQGSRPKWESWIAAEAKRRTLYTMYLFDNVLSALDGLPTFLGTELRGLPAPAGKTLWQARSRQKWEHAYNSHLVTFPDGSLRIDELWPVGPDVDEAARTSRQKRIETWLEDLDEFGTMLYAVTSITHNLE